MRQSLLTIAATLLATAMGCASSATTMSSSPATQTVGLKSLDGDVVFTGTTPEVRDGNLGLERETVATSGLWMDTSGEPAPSEDWGQPKKLDKVLKLMTPPSENDPAPEIAYLRDRRAARQ